ncbi:MAG: PAS domain S-box protein [Spirochaetaceae bacterium]|nr:PAS domain S-box protein [Spirochaetaceae bacterium]
MRVIFAVGDPAERSAFARLVSSGGCCLVHYPRDIAEVEKLFSTDGADVIVTDFSFHNGAFADWLTFWPLPAVLLTDSGDDAERIEKTIRDEASVFLERDPEGRYLARLPILIRKVLNIRESITRQNAHLQMTEHQYLNLLQAIPDIVYILDGEGRFMYLNDSVRNLGHDPAKLIGKHFSEIVHPADVPKVSRGEVLRAFTGVCTGQDNAPKLFDERRAGNRMTKNLELRLRRNVDAEGFLYASVNAYGEVNCAGWKLPEYENIDLGTVGIIRDITVRKEHEQELEAALAAKEILLKEIHHRVKNNLQVVSSLLNLQENVVEDESARHVFLECQTQVQSMAMVHEVLYRSDNFEGVEMQRYFERLVEYLSGVYDGGYRGVRCAVEADSIVLDLDAAIPIALIVNELVSNSFKHGFPGGRTGNIRIEMTDRQERWEVSVSDDGVGFEATRNPEREHGLGTELIHALSAQLRGEVELSAGHGARTTIRFPAS